jgi:DNA-binding NarL/FixJ family response regulator
VTAAPLPVTQPDVQYVSYTRRELAVLHELMKEGAENQVIADRMGISLDTVKSHLRNLMGKAAIGNRTELVLRLLRREIIPLDPMGRAVDVS